MKQPAIPAKLTVKLNDSDRELFMSFGLLNRVTKILGGTEGVEALARDPDLQEKVLLEVFTVREKGKDIEVPESLDDISISLEDVSNVLEWVGGHVIDFFMTQAERATKNLQKESKRMGDLKSTADGLSNSLLGTRVA